MAIVFYVRKDGRSEEDQDGNCKRYVSYRAFLSSQQVTSEQAKYYWS
jgi:hypothetical protein